MVGYANLANIVQECEFVQSLDIVLAEETREARVFAQADS